MPDLNYAERPETPADLANFSFSHAAQHRDYIRVVFQTLGIRLDEYILDPIDPQNMGNWVNLHQIMHSQVDAALGIPGYNLTQLDWNDPQSWLDLHADSHARESAILGL